MTEPPSAQGPARPRGRPPRLSRDQIAATALALIDERGLDAFTMRRLATRLGADPMAVYRHFRNKDDLLAAISDQVLAELVVDPAGDWRQQAERLVGQLRERLADHPGLGAALAAAPLTAASLATTQQAASLFRTHGFAPPVASAGVMLLFSFVLGFSLIEAVPARPTDPVEIPAPGDFEIGLAILLDGLAAQR